MPRAAAAGGPFRAWTQSVAAVEAHFGTSLAKGLSAPQVTAARARYGYNELDKEAAKPLWKLVLEQFDDPLVKARSAPAKRKPPRRAGESRADAATPAPAPWLTCQFASPVTSGAAPEPSCGNAPIAARQSCRPLSNCCAPSDSDGSGASSSVMR